MIAITGGIGSGKSVALKTLKDAGYPVLSSDEIVKDLYKTHQIKLLLKDMFPMAVSGKEKLRIDTKKIGAIVFKDSELHTRLTNTITPLVLKEILRKAKKHKKTLFVEVPLLFECEYEDHFDGVIVIKREESKRIESVKERSKLSEQQIKERINRQVDYDKIDLSKYVVIENNGDKKSFEKKILESALEF